MLVKSIASIVFKLLKIVSFIFSFPKKEAGRFCKIELWKVSKLFASRPLGNFKRNAHLSMLDDNINRFQSRYLIVRFDYLGILNLRGAIIINFEIRGGNAEVYTILFRAKLWIFQMWSTSFCYWNEIITRDFIKPFPVAITDFMFAEEGCEFDQHSGDSWWSEGQAGRSCR